MPGDYCSVFGCRSCRRTYGIGIWKLPSARNAEYKKWREEWLSAITKTRVIDEDFKKQIDSDKVFTCEKHFKPEDVELWKYCRRYVRFCMSTLVAALVNSMVSYSKNLGVRTCEAKICQLYPFYLRTT